MTIDSRFSAGGLASGIDTGSIVDQLVKLERRPIDLLKGRQEALKSQISLLGDLSSKLSAFQTAAKSLGETGALALSATTPSTAFAATPTSGGSAGRYAVIVDELATSAQARSQSFSNAFEDVRTGTLRFTVGGSSWDINIVEEMSLHDVATAISQSGAPLSATVLTTGSNSYLSITARNSGYPVGGAPGDALTITENLDGVGGRPLGLAITNPATNARVRIDGLTFTRTSNEIEDVVPGVRLSLKATSATASDLILTHDVASTQKRLESFVNAYNEVQKALQKQLNVAVAADRDRTLAGDSVVRGLQAAMERLISTEVPGLPNVRALADLGVKTNRDGTLSIDSTALGKAIARDPAAIDALFSKATTGLGDIVDAMVDSYVKPVSGLLSARKTGLGKSIASMDTQMERLELRVANYRENLLRQFSAMETVVSGLKALGNFIAQNELSRTGGKS